MNTYQWILVVAGTLSFSRFVYLVLMTKVPKGGDDWWDHPIVWLCVGVFFVLVFNLQINHKETKEIEKKPDSGYDCRKIENKEK